MYICNMKMDELSKKLQEGKIVYIKDDFEDVAIRVVPGTDNIERVFIKRGGRVEKDIDRTNSLVFDVEIGGEEITKEEYSHL